MMASERALILQLVVFRRATLTRLSGGSASKIDPLNL